jgi:Xaa-Pro aminopeptidase
MGTTSERGVLSDGERVFGTKGPSTPFNATKLDGLMAERGVDVVLATSGHNVRYLLGGYLFFMYAWADSVGLSRYLPVVGYVRGRSDAAFYVGAGNEDWGTEVASLWVPEVENAAWSTVDAARRAAGHVRARSGGNPTVAVEYPYLPADAMEALRRELPAANFVDASPLLEELRAVKTPAELDLFRGASRDVVAAMLATFGGSGEGDSKREIAERLRVEEARRGLTFAYCLIGMGRSFNRAPSDQRWREGEVLSLDSGAERDGYFGDLLRMAVLGEPSGLMEELLAEVEAVQQAARRPIRAGAIGREIYEAALAELGGCPHADRMSFLAHGTGLVTHEAPRLTDTGSPPYPADHRDRPLEAGMVLSVETHVQSPAAGFVKLEDTVFVTEDGWEAPADFGRGWNVVGG